MEQEKLIPVVVNIAEAMVEHRMGAHIMWEDKEDGSQGFTEEAQDLFNELFDIIEPIILKHIK